MKELSKEEMKNIKGAGLSGSLFDGIGDIIDSVSSCISGIGQLVFLSTDNDHAKEEIKFGKDGSISWDDTPQSVQINVKSAFDSSSIHNHGEQINSNENLLSQHHETGLVQESNHHVSDEHHILGSIHDF